MKAFFHGPLFIFWLLACLAPVLLTVEEKRFIV